MTHRKTHRRKHSKRGNKSRKNIKRGGFWPFESTQSTSSYPSVNASESNYTQTSSNPFSQFGDSVKSIFSPGISMADRFKKAAYTTTGFGSESPSQVGATMTNPLQQQSYSPYDTRNPMQTYRGGRRHRRSHKKSHRRKH
jgi:hypothetical protein